MAVCAIRIGEKGRNCLGLTLLLFNLSISVMCFLTTIIGIYVAVIFHHQRNVLKDFNYSKLNISIICFGLILTAFHLFGAKLSFDCGNVQNRYRFKKFMLTFFGLLFVALALLIALSISTSAAIHHLAKGYEKGFKELMETYDTDKDKRMEIDLLQVTSKCCGSKGYKDWLEVAWYPDEFIRPEKKGRKEKGVPFTCCDPTYMGPCLHDAGDKGRPGYLQAGAESFYPDGCADVITVNLRWAMDSLSQWLVFPMMLEMIVMVGTKYLMTSINSAAEAGDEEGPGYGYLMQRCPFPCFDFLERDISPSMQKNQKSSS